MISEENLYSRQIMTYGSTLSSNISLMNCLVVGASGVGLEVCKNLALTGINQITIFDNGVITKEDTEACLYYKVEEIGASRLKICIPHLKCLNPHVKVREHIEDISADIIEINDVIIITKTEIINVENIQKMCRDMKKGLVISETFGYAGFLYTDFGEKFISNNEFGAEYQSIPIECIRRSNPGWVKTCSNHYLSDDDVVIFKSIYGMSELSQLEPQKVKVIDEFTFEIEENTENFNEFISGDMIQVPVKRIFNFKDWASMENGPTFVNQFSHRDINNKQTHIFFRALRHYYKIHNNYPSIFESNEAEQCYLYALNLNEINQSHNKFYVEKLDKELAIKCFKLSKFQPAPVCSLFGNIAAQEAIKFSHEYSPQENLLYIDFYELYTDQLLDYYMNGDTSELASKMEKLNIFIIGAGALGCEYLKLLALQGIGVITITDNDSIETSNLNRQFLFRNSDLGKNKSLTASEAVKKFREFNVHAYELKASVETETCFTDDFYDKQDIILSAVDSVDARRYLGHKSILHKKIFFNSGTDRLYASSEVIIPDITNPYLSSGSNLESSYLSCTIKRNPYLVEHCIAWSKEKFVSLFEEAPKSYNSYLENPEEYIKQQESSLKQEESINFVKMYSELRHFSNISAVKKCSYIIFNYFFIEDIKKIIELYPEDMVKDDAKYWAPPCRFPQLIEEIDIECIRSIFVLLCDVLGIIHDSDIDDIDFDKNDINNYCFNSLYQADHSNNKLKILNFDKDNDSHIDFIHSTTNLRAKNYHIDPCERYISKKISGNISPSISATGAIATSLNVIEIMKHLLNIKIENRNQYSINLINCDIGILDLDLDLNIYPKENEIIEPKNLTRWNKLIVTGDMTFEQVISLIKEKFNATLSQISYAGKQVFENKLSNYEKLFFKQSPTENKFLKKLNTLKKYENHKYMLLNTLCKGQGENKDTFIVIPYIQVNFL